MTRRNVLLSMLILLFTSPLAAHSVSAGCLAIESYGGVGDGSTDNVAAFNSVMSAIGSTNNCISFGPGKFRFSGNISKTTIVQQSIGFIGSGKDVTVLYWNSGGGLTLNRGSESTFTIRDMTFTTGIASGGTAMNFTDAAGGCAAGGKSQSLIDNVAIRGDDGIDAADYWNMGISATDVNLLNIYSVDIFGEMTGTKASGILYQGTSPSCLAVVNNINSSYFQNLGSGYIYGNEAQGVTINQSNFNNGVVGVAVPPTSSGAFQLTVSNSQFNTTQNQIFIDAPIQAVMITNNLFFITPGNNGIFIQNGILFSIIGNTFQSLSGPVNGRGIYVTGNESSNAGIITGNTYYRLATGNSFSTCGGWNVQSNAYSQVVTRNDTSGGCTACAIGGGSQ